MADRATIIGHPAIPLRNAIHRSLRLHLLARSDRIAFFQELRERRARAVRDGVLKRLRQVGECHVRMNRLDVAQ
jgi:hypothetical protein